MRLEKSTENNIEWITGDSRVGMTLSQAKFVNRITRLHKEHPDEVGFLSNEDGSVFASVPISWIKISAPRKLTEEQRQAAAERARKLERKGSNKATINVKK